MIENVTRIEFVMPAAGLMFNDETEFDTWSEEELAQLWWEFCKENELISVFKERVLG